MAEVRLTPQQLSVVEHRGGPLLVSAAAGSGKTKVLVDRLLSMVCDPIDAAQLDSFLIITYTKAAASELRAKIASALGERLAENPDRVHLLRQMNRLYSARISTVHSFCADLLRSKAAEAERDPEFRVAEDAECAVLRSRVLARLLEEEYANIKTSEGFRQLVDSLGYGRDDRALEQIILDTYNTMQCQADPKAWIEKCRGFQEADADPAQTIWGRYLAQNAKDTAQRLLISVRRAEEQTLGYEKLEKAYLPTLLEIEQLLLRIADADKWDSFAEARRIRIPAFKPVRGFEDPELQESIKAVKDRVKHALERVLAPFRSDAGDEMLDFISSIQPAFSLLELVERFETAYSEEKRRRRIVDFSDLEHLALKLLRRDSVAKEVSAQFTEVMVDEYQDTNAVQDAIFRAVSDNGKRLFMVGDVKQSIYRFRLADPSIFLEKYRSFLTLEKPHPDQPRKIQLSKNFRSRPQILDAVNHVFRTVMSEQVGDLAYGPEESLEQGASFAPLPQNLVELHCIQTGADEDSPGKTVTEAEFAADRIAQMLREKMPVSDGTGGTRPVCPGDIVILMRSPRSSAGSYVRALEQRGIRTQTDQSGDVLQTAEVQTLLAMLQLIDNPHQDIPLLAVLNGPLFEMHPDFLAEVRARDRSSDLFTALQKYASEDPAATHLLAELDELREQAQYLPLDKLIDTVVRKFGFRETYGAMPDGPARESNLQVFVEYAAAYASGSYRLLMDFLCHISDLQQQGRTIAAASGGSADAVQILSIHKSKGLEYPVVLLCDLSRKFNLSDLSKPVLLDQDFGVGADVVDTELLVRYPSIAKRAIAAKKRAEMISEELRVLYVAMTRPKDMLVMTYCTKHLTSELKKLAETAEYPADRLAAADVKSPGQWVLMAAFCRPEAQALFSVGERPACVRYCDDSPWRIETHFPNEANVQPVLLEPQSKMQESVQKNRYSWDESAYGYQYPYAPAVAIPAKLTATQMKGRALDAEASEFTPISRTYAFEPPGKGLNAAQRGSATHLVMQYLDFENCLHNGVGSEVSRLLEKGFITKEQASAIQIAEIERLLRSELGERICRHTLAREMKFSILLPAERCIQNAPPGEKLMLQGVADCILSEPDGLTLLDYKTDRIQSGNEAERAKYYLEQMRTYCMAVEELYGRHPQSCLVYFFATGKAIDLIELI